MSAPYVVREERRPTPEQASAMLAGAVVQVEAA